MMENKQIAKIVADALGEDYLVEVTEQRIMLITKDGATFHIPHSEWKYGVHNEESTVSEGSVSIEGIKEKFK